MQYVMDTAKCSILRATSAVLVGVMGVMGVAPTGHILSTIFLPARVTLATTITPITPINEVWST